MIRDQVFFREDLGGLLADQTVKMVTLDQAVGVRIPVPQPPLCSPFYAVVKVQFQGVRSVHLGS
jgi:hypothetical protein